MKKLNVFLFSILLTSTLMANVASAQIVGGILCGLGVYCPPQVPPGPKPALEFILVEGAPIGKTLPDFYNYYDYVYLSEAIKGVANRLTPFYSFTWEKKVNQSFIVQSTFEVLKVGKRFDGYVPCFQYKHTILVREPRTAEGVGRVLNKEELVGNACSVTPDYRLVGGSRYVYMYYDTTAPNIIFKK